MLLGLTVKTWRDRWRGLLAWCVGLLAIVAVELAVYPSIRDSASEMSTLLENFPDVFQGMFTLEDYTTGPGFLNVELFSIMVPLVFIAIGVTWGASATADEERVGTADILLTMPISRTSVIIAKMLATVVALVAVAIVLSLGIAAGAPIIDITIGLGALTLASLGAALLGLLFGSIAFFLGALTGSRGLAMGVSIGLAIAGFLVKSMASMVETFDTINPYNPFEWVLAGNPLVDGLAWSSAGWLVLASAVFFTAAVLAFRRRDISAR